MCGEARPEHWLISAFQTFTCFLLSFLDLLGWEQAEVVFEVSSKLSMLHYCLWLSKVFLWSIDSKLYLLEGPGLFQVTLKLVSCLFWVCRGLASSLCLLGRSVLFRRWSSRSWFYDLIDQSCRCWSLLLHIWVVQAVCCNACCWCEAGCCQARSDNSYGQACCKGGWVNPGGRWKDTAEAFGCLPLAFDWGCLVEARGGDTLLSSFAPPAIAVGGSPSSATFR